MLSAESKEYCEFCAHKVEEWLLPMIIVSYVVVVAIIFGVADLHSNYKADVAVG